MSGIYVFGVLYIRKKFLWPQSDFYYIILYLAGGVLSAYTDHCQYSGTGRPAS